MVLDPEFESIDADIKEQAIIEEGLLRELTKVAIELGINIERCKDHLYCYKITDPFSISCKIYVEIHKGAIIMVYSSVSLNSLPGRSAELTGHVRAFELSNPNCFERALDHVKECLK